VTVELRDFPELRGKPVAVGGESMISTANYEARKYGVRSAMPGFIARVLCPALVFVPHNFAKYTKVANQTREIFAKYDPNFSAMSLDEATLDVTDFIATNLPKYLDAWARDFQNQKHELPGYVVGEEKMQGKADEMPSAAAGGGGVCAAEDDHGKGANEHMQAGAEAESVNSNTREAARRQYFKTTSSKRHECVGMAHHESAAGGGMLHYSDDDDDDSGLEDSDACSLESEKA
jgi:hypothetical protein